MLWKYSFDRIYFNDEHPVELKGEQKILEKKAEENAKFRAHFVLEEEKYATNIAAHELVISEQSEVRINLSFEGKGYEERHVFVDIGAK